MWPFIGSIKRSKSTEGANDVNKVPHDSNGSLVNDLLLLGSFQLLQTQASL